MYVAYVSHSYHILLWTRIKRQVRQYRVFINLNLALSALAHGSFYEHTWLKNRGGRIYVLLKSITYNTLMARAHNIMSLLVGPRQKKKKSASVHRESAANPALAGVRQTFGHNKLWTISQWASVLIVKRWNYSSGGQSERVKQFATIHRRFVSSFSEDAGQSSLFL